MNTRYILKTFDNMKIVGTTEQYNDFVINVINLFNNNDKLELDLNLLKKNDYVDNKLSIFLNKNLSSEIKDRIISLNENDFILWEAASKKQKEYI